MVAGNKSFNDGSGGQWSGQRMTDQGRTQQQTNNGSGKGNQQLATTKVRGLWLAMAAKGGGSRRGDCHGQRGVIKALEAAEAS
jgi:hypothetical protein